MVEPLTSDQQLFIVAFGDGVIKLLAHPCVLHVVLPEKPKAQQADDRRQCYGNGDKVSFPLHTRKDNTFSAYDWSCLLYKVPQ